MAEQSCCIFCCNDTSLDQRLPWQKPIVFDIVSNMICIFGIFSSTYKVQGTRYKVQGSRYIIHILYSLHIVHTVHVVHVVHIVRTAHVVHTAHILHTV